MVLDDVDGSLFEDVLKVWCGMKVIRDFQLEGLMNMARLADRFQMIEIAMFLEDSIIKELQVDVCAELLMASKQLCLTKVEAAAHSMVKERFEDVARTSGFLELDAETLGLIMDEDELGLRKELGLKKEEGALEGLVRWMKGGGGGGGGLRGRELLQKVRFGLMDQEYLESAARTLLPEEYLGWIDCLVREALDARDSLRAGGVADLQRLGAKWMVPRESAVLWKDYSACGAGLRLEGHTWPLDALAQCNARMCSGSQREGKIRVWNITTLEQERTLYHDFNDSVLSLAAVGRHLFSGHELGGIRVWDVETGQLLWLLEGHEVRVHLLCVCDERLVSLAQDLLIKVWGRATPEAAWTLERELPSMEFDTRVVETAAGCGRRLALCSDFSDDGSIEVWDVATGELEAALAGHERKVSALAWHGARLFSGCIDGVIKAWSPGTWAGDVGRGRGTWAEASVRAYGEEVPRRITCMAVCGRQLVTGVNGPGPEVRVWDLETLACEHTLPQSDRAGPGCGVYCLAAVGGEVWGCVGREVVVWGRD